MIKVNDHIECRITGIQPYGIFVEYKTYSGLIHISELSHYYVSEIEEVFQVGDLIKVAVLEVDEENQRLKLSYKQSHQVHPRIQKNTRIKIGFHSLAKALPHWIAKKNRK
ncbi:MAG: S1 RNA-binding domain-containing protein [Acholeplasmataceae bacterium]